MKLHFCALALAASSAITTVSASRLKASTELAKKAQVQAAHAKRQAVIRDLASDGRRSRNKKRACSSYLMGMFCDYATDPDNCGGQGKKCPHTWDHGSGAVCHNSMCGAAKCDENYAWSWSQHKCIDISSDLANCGKIGNHCNDATALTQACQSGKCVATSCKDGDSLEDGMCTSAYATDINNCGSRGRVCPTSFANGQGAACTLGVCVPESCDAGFAWSSTDGICQDIQSSATNCGELGHTCKYENGKAACKEGACVLDSCDSGFSKSGQTCNALDFSSDLENCGKTGNKCSFKDGSGTCTAGKCTYESCSLGHKLAENSCKKVDLQTDVDNCGSFGVKCQSMYVNGGPGRCHKGACESDCEQGFTWDPQSLYCRPTSRDILNCGGLGKVCAPSGAASAICVSGQCFASTCKSGYELLPGTGLCSKIDTATNINHCGAINRPCVFAPAKATGICQNSKCVITKCPENFSLKKDVCIADKQKHVRLKAKKKVIPTLCPKGEQACPIANSATFERAASHHFTHPTNEFSGIMTGGGYECLDIKTSLESCGGCSSTGEGVDCSKISHARGVGCDVGKCHVFSCKSGWQPSLDATSCVPAPSKESNRRSQMSRALHRRNIGSQHLHGRAHHAVHRASK